VDAGRGVASNTAGFSSIKHAFGLGLIFLVIGSTLQKPAQSFS
jgi:hypothetical protein